MSLKKFIGEWRETHKSAPLTANGLRGRRKECVPRPLLAYGVKLPKRGELSKGFIELALGALEGIAELNFNPRMDAALRANMNETVAALSFISRRFPRHQPS